MLLAGAKELSLARRLAHSEKYTTALALANSGLHSQHVLVFITRHDKGSLAKRTDRGESVGHSMLLLARSQ
jgi:hypothetical protein